MPLSPLSYVGKASDRQTGPVFSSSKAKAHGLAISMPVTPAFVCQSTFSNILSSEATGQIELKFYMKSP